MKNVISIVTTVILLACSNVYAQTRGEEFAQLRQQVIQLMGQDIEKAEELLVQFIEDHQNELTDAEFQSAYMLQSDIRFIQRRYFEAAEVLKFAIDRYESDVEQFLTRQHNDYKKYISKPILKVDNWPENKKSCEASEGKWGIWPTGCNNAVVDGVVSGNVCS